MEVVPWHYTSSDETPRCDCNEQQLKFLSIMIIIIIIVIIIIIIIKIFSQRWTKYSVIH